MRPRKFNYFNIIPTEMQAYAAFSYYNQMISQVILCYGHILIALNRFTSFYYPLTVEKIWSDKTATLCVVSLWTLSIVTSLTVLLVFAKSPHFELASNGIVIMNGGSVKAFSSLQSVVANMLTVLICFVCYLCCFIKNRYGDHKYKSVEKRLLLCALASSLPFCVEMVRSIIVLLTVASRGYGTLHECAKEFWFYEMEIVVTSSMWMQLAINRNVRNQLLKTFGFGGPSIRRMFPTT
ncbi:hypothetical protein Aduo_003095 [Ancylostoma duodenale]